MKIELEIEKDEPTTEEEEIEYSDEDLNQIAGGLDNGWMPDLGDRDDSPLGS